MNPDDTQTVTEDQATADTPNEGKEAASEATGAQDTTETDWEALLADSQTEPEIKPEPKTEPEANELIKRIKVLEGKEQRHEKERSDRDLDEGLKEAAENIRSNNEGLKGVSDILVRGFIYALNEKHPQLNHAFSDRRQNPKAWEKAQEMIGKSMSKEFADMPDADLTAGVKAAADAVRGVSTTLPAKEDHDNKHYAKMTDAEFNTSIKEELESAGG